LLWYASSPSGNLLATSMSSDTVLGLVLTISSTKSERQNPSTKASIACSSDTLSAEFFIMLQHCIYERSDSPLFCVQALSSSIEAGHM
jgi:hypothetical protein